MSDTASILEQCRELRSTGRLADAVMLLEQYLSRFPGIPEMSALLGQIYEQMGNHTDAIRHLEDALACNPCLLDARFTLGVAHQMSGSHLLAIDLLNQVIEAAPDLPHAYRYRGLALQDLGSEMEAKESFEQALGLAPNYPEAMGSLAHLLMKYSHFDAAEALLLRALELKPAMSDVQNSLARLYQLAGKSEEASIMFEGVLRAEPDNHFALSNYLYSLCYLDSVLPEVTAAKHISLCESNFPVPPDPAPSKKVLHVPEERRLRVGYLSSDFCLHSVSFFIEPILLNHNRKRFEIFCYSNRVAADDTTQRIRALDLEWRDIAYMSAEEVAKWMRKDELDLLVDLSGHTASNRLDVCALKPAPVMVSWIGYPHSTGMKQFDYYISDPVCDPPGATEHLFAEKIWRLSRVFSCYIPPMEFPPVTTHPTCATNGYVTFGSFNNLAKVSDVTVRLWSEILHQVPGSKLLIKSASLGGKTAQKQILQKFAGYGVGEHQLVLKVHTPTPYAHLKMYGEVDIALDTYPYNGTTTTCEALWMGVPVVTYAGRYHLARVSASFLTALDCTELIADTEKEFVSIAVSLAADLDRLQNYRNSLRTRMAHSPLMDAAGVTHELEQAFSGMLTSMSKESGNAAN